MVLSLIQYSGTSAQPLSHDSPIPSPMEGPSLKLLVNTIDTNLADRHMASHLALSLDCLVQRPPTYGRRRHRWMV